MITRISRLNLIKVCLISFFALTIFGQAKAQSQITSFVQIAQPNGNKILQAYADPFMKRQADGWADGWTNTAAHEKLSFQLFSLSGTFVDNNEKTFDASTLGLDPNVIRVHGSPINQTVSGGQNNTGAAFDLYAKNPYTGEPLKVATVAGANGLNLRLGGISMVPTIVTPQLGFGFSSGTEVMVRLIPDIHYSSNTEVTVVGLGLKQNLSDLIFHKKDKGIRAIVPFDLAVYTGYSMENINYKLDVQPDPTEKRTSGNENTNYNNQKINVKTTNYTVGAIISKKILFLTPHAGIAYSASQTTLGVLGTYPTQEITKTGMTIKNVQDPLLIIGQNSGMSANIGLNLNVFFVKLSTDLIVGKYDRMNVSLRVAF